MKKVLYFDTETTGIDPQKHAIIQLSGIIEIDGEVKETFNFKMRPLDTEEIDPKAMEIHGMTEEQVKGYDDSTTSLRLFLGTLGKYVDKFNKEDKFFPAGYNVKFDMEMLHAFARKRGQFYLGSFISWSCIDAMPLIHYLSYRSDFKLPDYKLKTVCDHFGIPIEAHDAMSDIKATRDLLVKIKEIIKMDEVTLNIYKDKVL